MGKLDKNSDIYRWVTQNPLPSEINISNLRLVTETKYNYQILFQRDSMAATPSMFVSKDSYSRLNPYDIFGKISYHLVHNPDLAFMTNITVTEERYLCDKLNIAYVDSWLHGGMIPSIEQHFKVVGVNPISMQLYWSDVLHLNPRGDKMLVPTSTTTGNNIRNKIMNKGLFDE